MIAFVISCLLYAHLDRFSFLCKSWATLVSCVRCDVHHSLDLFLGPPLLATTFSTRKIPSSFSKRSRNMAQV